MYNAKSARIFYKRIQHQNFKKELKINKNKKRKEFIFKNSINKREMIKSQQQEQQLYHRT